MPDDFESNYNAGLNFYRNKQFDDAIIKFKMALSFDSNSSEIHYYLGLSYLQKELYNDAITEFQKSISINPRDPDIHVYLALAYQNKGNFREYIDELKIAIKMDKVNNPLLKKLVELTFSSDQYTEDGINLFRDLIKDDPKILYYHSILASLLESKDRLEEALLELKELIKLDPLNTENYVNSGILLKKIGRIDEAIQLVKGASKSFPNDASLKIAHQNLFLDKIVSMCEKKSWKDAVSLFHSVLDFDDKNYGKLTTSPNTNKLTKKFKEKKRVSDALYLFLEAFPKFPKSNTLQDGIYDLLKDLKIRDDVRDDYICSIRDGNDNAEIHVLLGDSLEYKHGINHEILFEEYRRAIKLDPEYYLPHFRIGEILIGEMGNNNKGEEALKEFQNGIKKIDPNNENLGYWLYWYAVLLYQCGNNQVDEALINFNRATKLDPENFREFYENLLLRFLFSNQIDSCEIEKFEICFKKCVLIFEELIKSGDNQLKYAVNFSCAHQALGRIYAKKGEFDDAISEYKKAILIDPSDANHHIYLAEIYEERDQIDNAISEYNKAIECSPDFAQYYKTLGDLLVKKGDLLNALSKYKQATELWPNEENFSKAYLDLRATLNTSLEYKQLAEKILDGKIDQHFQIDDDFQQIISKGENESVEFKSSALWSKNFTKEEINNSVQKDVKKFGTDASKFVVAKTIAGFLNTEGGNLVIGIQENKDGNLNNIIGIKSEFSKLKDQCIDGYRRMIVDEIIKKYLPSEISNHLANYIKIEFPEYQGKNICWIKIKKADTPVHLKTQSEDFFIRTDAETCPLTGRSATNYCLKHFKEKLK